MRRTIGTPQCRKLKRNTAGRLFIKPLKLSLVDDSFGLPLRSFQAFLLDQFYINPYTQFSIQSFLDQFYQFALFVATYRTEFAPQIR